MGRERQTTKPDRKSAGIFIAACALLLCFSTMPSLRAWAESVVLQLPLPEVSGDHFGYSASRGRLHAGVDLRARTPTPVTYQGNFQSCTKGGSGLIIGSVANACGVTQRFLHLTSCSGGKFVTGNSGINPKTGRNYDFHLHWEVYINGTAVDPEYAAGKDLCNEQVRKDVLEDAKKKGSGSGGGGASANNNSPAPPANTTDTGSIAYVAPGATNPVTGAVNTGGAYYYTVTPDGQTIVEIAPDPGDENESPILPPASANVVQTTNTSNEVTGCATDTWTAMVNQAVLQTRREMLYNERYIAKPDSVLAYSCFNKTLTGGAAKNMGVFSATKRWVNKQIDIVGKTVTVNKELGEDTMDGAIRNAAVVPAESYMNGVFNHGYLGGMLGATSEADSESSEQSDAPCTKMAEVWQAAKCMNITDDTPFKKFDELIDADSDPRIYPPKMQCKNTGITQDMINIAQGRDVKFDKVDPYSNMLMPDGNSCAQPPLFTGVTVVRRQGGGIITQVVNYPDGICISPGCSYQNPGGNGQGTCQVKGP